MATGDSGHGFKFLPVLGQHIVDILGGVADGELAAKWAWPAAGEKVVTRDGSRAVVQLVLDDDSHLD